MRAITVCYQYHDILAKTLPTNVKLFESFTVVTSEKDKATIDLCEMYGADLFLTELFWDNGAIFNKFAALEAGMDQIGRSGSLAILDADVVMPAAVANWEPQCGCLYTPLRRMQLDIRAEVTPEKLWKRLRFHRASEEHAGYCQMFHAEDPMLGPGPWHETDWTWAGGADSFFALRWPDRNRLRPPFECLHLGPAGVNWAGRVTEYTDGTKDPEAEKRSGQFNWLMNQRKEMRSRNLPRFTRERL